MSRHVEVGTQWLHAALRALEVHPISGPRVALVLMRRGLEEAAAAALADLAVDVGQSQLAARFLCWEQASADRMAIRDLYATWSRCSTMLHAGGDLLPIGAETLRREIETVGVLLTRTGTECPSA